MAKRPKDEELERIEGTETLFALNCTECGNEILAIDAPEGTDIYILAGGEMYGICGECGKTDKYVWTHEGEPYWKGFIN